MSELTRDDVFIALCEYSERDSKEAAMSILKLIGKANSLSKLEPKYFEAVITALYGATRTEGNVTIFPVKVEPGNHADAVEAALMTRYRFNIDRMEDAAKQGASAREALFDAVIHSPAAILIIAWKGQKSKGRRLGGTIAMRGEAEFEEWLRTGSTNCDVEVIPALNETTAMHWAQVIQETTLPPFESVASQILH